MLRRHLNISIDSSASVFVKATEYTDSQDAMVWGVIRDLNALVKDKHDYSFSGDELLRVVEFSPTSHKKPWLYTCVPVLEDRTECVRDIVGYYFKTKMATLCYLSNCMAEGWSRLDYKVIRLGWVKDIDIS